MSEKLQDLRLQASVLQRQIWELEATERRKASDRLVGKCFLYRNCYSCPKGPEDYWNLYQRVLRVTHDGNLQVFSFQVDKDGVISVETRTRSSGSLGEQISAAKLKAAWRVLKRRIDACDGSALGERA